MNKKEKEKQNCRLIKKNRKIKWKSKDWKIKWKQK